MERRAEVGKEGSHPSPALVAPQVWENRVAPRGVAKRLLSSLSVLIVPPSEMEITAVRAQGAGGQNVNKVSNAIQLRFDIRASSLPEPVKQRLMARSDQRINREGVVVIKAQRHRSLELNRTEAIERLHALVASAAAVPKKRKPTKPTRAARERRLESKAKRARTKAERSKVFD
jgi:ribosome-associated protein